MNRGCRLVRSEKEEVEQAAMRLLVLREHSRKELRRKLAARSFDSRVVEQVLHDLEGRRYLSDERFAEQYIVSRSGKGYGPLRIRAELREKGVNESVVEAGLEEGDFDWASLMRETARRKFGDPPPHDYRERARQARFLEYRGFPVDLIRRFLWDDE